jgi:hypothetical protein
LALEPGVATTIKVSEEDGQGPKGISAEEFDARFDRGEDVSEYVDCRRGVHHEPPLRSLVGRIWQSVARNFRVRGPIKLPSLDYLLDVIEKQGQGALERQGIPLDVALSDIVNFEDFLVKRRELLVGMINDFLRGFE